jgi:hypothetical protein
LETEDQCVFSNIAMVRYIFAKITEKRVGMVKVNLEKILESPEGAKLYLQSFFNMGDRLWWNVNVTPRLLYPQERHRLLNVQEAGWGLGPVWMSAQNIIPTEIRTPDRPARERSLYQLRYPNPETVRISQNICEPVRSLAISASRLLIHESLQTGTYNIRCGSVYK